VDVTHPVAVRSGAAAYFDLPIFEDVVLSTLREAAPDHRIVATTAEKGRPLAGFEWFERTILVIGGEAGGATEDIAADTTISIPCQVESLNAAVAGGILMWEAVRQGKANL
jgi:TrmH family RNA methyltransferase